ncbi:MAG: acyl-CoA dehydrogenase family protein [Gammaproteobacteria bacterium]|nr:acyl-CoA dehydrogenase family protein [Gammaproteobacteria bacterium]
MSNSAHAAVPTDNEAFEMLDMLRDSAADFCRRSLEVTRLRALRGASPAFDRKLWSEMCELGWAGILAPEAAGGLGLGAQAVGAVCRQLGRVLAPEPMIESGVGAVAMLSACDSATAHAMLGKVIEGSSVLVCALAEDAEFASRAPRGIEARSANGGYVLKGEVADLPLATDVDGFLLNVTLDNEAAVVCCARDVAGLTLSARSLADGTQAATLACRDVVIDADAVLARGAAASAALKAARELSRLASASYMVGLAEQIFDITIDYLRTRQQFGKPIGSFQALQHRAVDLYIQQALAAAVVDEALRDFDAAGDDSARARAASRAKYRANEAALMIARQAVQLHGGIGYTDECDVGLYLNRALVLAARYGNTPFHGRRLAGLVSGSLEDDAGHAANVPAAPANGQWDGIGDEDFRAIVRRWFEAEYPADMRYPSRRPRWAEIKPWYLKLSRQGWVAPAWPAEHGGMGLSPSKLLIFIEEQERWGIGRAPDMGIQMVGPLLIRHGTAEQRARYLPKILAGEEIWCQGYSEPNAGSDLASLKTEALPDGDEFVINGQKTWTTLAQDATHMFCLARTNKSGKQQEGISFFLIDLDQPGVTIRPIRNIAGHEEFCEVFLDNVRVPANCLVGGLNQGWTIAKALLTFERIFIGSPKQSQYALMRLEALAEACNLCDDAAFAERLTRLKLDVLDLESIYQHFAAIVRRGEPLGPDVSLLKIWATETFARLSELMIEAAGAHGATLGKLDFNGAQVDVMSQFYNARPATIYGGSNEIQRNIIAKGVLRLPGA